MGRNNTSALGRSFDYIAVAATLAHAADLVEKAGILLRSNEDNTYNDKMELVIAELVTLYTSTTRRAPEVLEEAANEQINN